MCVCGGGGGGWLVGWLVGFVIFFLFFCVLRERFVVVIFYF